MDENYNNNDGNMPQHAVPYGNVPQHTASYGNMPHDAAPYRRLPQDAVIDEDEDVDYNLTTKEAARRCVDAGLPRIERTMLNWCQPDRNGESRMKCHYDHASRKWFINEESFEVALAEEISRAKSRGEFLGPKVEEEKTSVPIEKQPSQENQRNESSEGKPYRTADAEREFRDVAIASGVKDLRIKDLERQIEKLEDDVAREKTEKREYVERLITLSGRAGQLEGVISGPALLEAKNPEQEKPIHIDESDLRDDSQPVSRPFREALEQREGQHQETPPLAEFSHERTNEHTEKSEW